MKLYYISKSKQAKFNFLRRNPLRLIFCTIIFASVFISCSNFYSKIQDTLENIQNNSKSKQYVDVTGFFSLSGAYPDFETELNSVTDHRSAFPVFPASLDYTATATAAGDKVVDGIIANDKKSFTIPALETELEWTVTVELKIELESGSTRLMKDSCTKTITMEDFVLYHDFVLKPETDKGDENVGNVTLEIKFPQIVNQIKTSCLDNTNWTTESFDCTAAGGQKKSAIIQKTDLPAGFYSVMIDYIDNRNVTVYRDIQAINVFKNMNTTKWVSNGGSEIISIDGTYELTQQTIDNSMNATVIYVAASDSDHEPDVDNGTGSPFNPYKKISNALSYIKNYHSNYKDVTGYSPLDYTIKISGTVQENVNIDQTYDNNAQSITIEGVGTNPTLKAKQSGTTLSIDSTVPVKIKNLTITNGSNANGNGGGISIKKSSAYVELGDGVTVTNNSAKNGGGIYNVGNLYLNGKVIIGKESTTAATADNFGNKATYQGAGIYNEGNVYLGYKYDSTATTKYKIAEIDGGVYCNLNTNSESYSAHGGGIYCCSGKIFMHKTTGKECAVSYNCAKHGAGIYLGVGSGIKLTMEGGTIEGNKSTLGDGAGIYCTHGSSVTMGEGSLIKNNTGANNGGGVYLDYNNNSLTMTGGTIEGNEADNNGGAVYMHAMNTSFANLIMSGSAYIPCTIEVEENRIVIKNDVYILDKPACITLAGNLTNTVVASIRGGSDVIKQDTLVLKNSGVTDYVSSNFTKFKIIPNSSSDTFIVGNDGKLNAAYDQETLVAAIATMTGEVNVKFVGEIQTGAIVSAIKERLKNASLAITLDLSGATVENVSQFNFNTRHGIKSLVLPDTLGPGFYYENVNHDAGDDIVSFSISDSNPNYCTEDGILYNKDKTQLIVYPKAKPDSEITLPSTVKTLGSSAFVHANNLIKINGLEQLESISVDAFYYCTKLEEADLSGLTNSSLPMYAFEGASSLKKVIISSSVTSIGYNVFANCSALNEVHFRGTRPPTLTNANDHPEFYNCASDLKFYVPGGSKSNYLNSTNFSRTAYNYYASSLSSIIIEE